MVLLHLIRNEGKPHTQRQLADLIGIERVKMNRTLDTLEGMNMVQRQSCGEDRRIKRVLLTEEAREIASEIEEISRQLRSEVFNGIADEDIELCQHVFQRVLGNLAAAAR